MLHLSTPSAPRHRTKLLVVLISICVVLVFIGAIAFYLWTSRTTTGEVRELISAHLRPGASYGEITAFLDAEGIPHGPIDRAVDYSDALNAGYPPETPVVAAIVRNSVNYIITRGDIMIFFFLNNDNRLIDYTLEEVFSSI
jgi:hypothetical protein